MEDTSLDDFLDVGSESTEPADESHRDEAPDSEADEAGRYTDATSGADTGRVEPATTTFAWSSQGGVCARCGEQARKRWRGTEGLVCGACKEWSALDG
jgi:hypothetical protein